MYFTNPTLQNARLADFATATGTPNGTVVEVGVGGRVTIAGNITAANFYNQANSAMIAVYSVGGKSSASVKANAVVDSGVGQGESRNIAVSAGPVSYDLFNTSNAPNVANVIERNTNNDTDNSIDEIELVFDKDVVDFEAGDFRLFVGTTDINQPAISATYGKEPGNLTKEDKKRVVLKVEEFAGIGEQMNSFSSWCYKLIL